MRFLATICAAYGALGAHSAQSLTFRDADANKECVISYDGEAQLSTSCAFDSSSSKALAAHVDEVEKRMETHVENIYAAMAKQDAKILAVTKMQVRTPNFLLWKRGGD